MIAVRSKDSNFKHTVVCPLKSTVIFKNYTSFVVSDVEKKTFHSIKIKFSLYNLVSYQKFHSAFFGICTSKEEP